MYVVSQVVKTMGKYETAYYWKQYTLCGFILSVGDTEKAIRLCGEYVWRDEKTGKKVPTELVELIKAKIALDTYLGYKH
jgi:hypothetical protein